MRKNSKRGLTDQEKVMISAYFENGFEMKNAMLQAGYAESTSDKLSTKIFGRAHVQAEMARRRKRMAKKAELSQDMLIQQLMRRMFSGDTLAKYKKVQPDGSLAWDFTGATAEELALLTELGVDFYTEGRGEGAVVVKKFRVKEPDVQQAIMALARHLGMFNDSLEVKGSIIERLQAGRARVRQENMKAEPE
jgi:phage terminase small subunit